MTRLEWQVILPPDSGQGSFPSVTARDRKGMVRGMTPTPTVTDGWWVRGQVVPTSEGLTIRKISIEPSRMVWQKGVERVRADDEYDVDIDSEVMKLIDLTAIRSEYRRSMHAILELAEFMDDAELIRWKGVRNMALKKRRKRSVNNPESMYCSSQDVLDEAENGRGMRRRLGDRWGIAEETVKSRMHQLRIEEWIVGVGTKVMGGPEYIRHEKRQRINNSEEDN